MRVPIRQSEVLAQSKKAPVDHYLTQQKIDALTRELSDLDLHQRPEAIEEVKRTQEMGDLSENAAYQEAKWRLRRINSRIMSIQERLKQAIVIQKTNDGTVQIGSTVTVDMDGKQQVFEIVGEQETDPTRGRISFKSPIGSVLMGHKAHEELMFMIKDKSVKVQIIEIS